MQKVHTITTEEKNFLGEERKQKKVFILWSVNFCLRFFIIHTSQNICLYMNRLFTSLYTYTHNALSWIRNDRKWFNFIYQKLSLLFFDVADFFYFFFAHPPTLFTIYRPACARSWIIFPLVLVIALQ